MLSREVSVFRSARVYFSVGGVRYPSPSVTFEPPRDEVESVRQVVVPLVPNRLGRYVRLVLTFDLRWIMISEIHFVSGRCRHNDKRNIEFVSVFFGALCQ